MTTVTKSAEYLVDLYLSGDIDKEIISSKDAEGHDGVSDEDYPLHRDLDKDEGCRSDQEKDHVTIDQEFLRKKVGQDLKYCGNEFNKEFEMVKHKTLGDVVKDFFSNLVEKADGDAEAFWPKYEELMDNAVRDVGMDDTTNIMGAVLLSIKGLKELGSCVRTFALRYIGKRDLDAGLKRMEKKIETHPSLD